MIRLKGMTINDDLKTGEEVRTTPKPIWNQNSFLRRLKVF